ncbi:MAG: hypothetical protein K0R98_1183 [Rickettsiaceae bacterium]|jgi:hypothetical protein|nr:hypothetical protein [Rickettsiaceae bacterium]
MSQSINLSKIIEVNPDLPYSFIIELLLAKLEVIEGHVIPYEFG